MEERINIALLLAAVAAMGQVGTVRAWDDEGPRMEWSDRDIQENNGGQYASYPF